MAFFGHRLDFSGTEWDDYQRSDDDDESFKLSSHRSLDHRRSKLEIGENFEKRSKFKPVVKKLAKLKEHIKNRASKKKKNMRGGSTEQVEDDFSRPCSSLSFHSNAGFARHSQAFAQLDVIDFIDEEYLALRRRVRAFHAHLRKIHDHLDGALKAGPPIGGRLDALRSTFKMGNLNEYPELGLAKAFEDFNRTLRYDGKLSASLREIGDAFVESGSHRDKLVRDARDRFLAPLAEFVTRDWKQIRQSDKNLQDLAGKIQRMKIEAKASQADINFLMADFVSRRREVMNNFEYILRSEIPLTQRLVNLVQVYKIFHFDNMKVFDSLERQLRVNLGAPLQKPLWAEDSAPRVEVPKPGESQSMPALPTTMTKTMPRTVTTAPPGANKNRNAEADSEEVLRLALSLEDSAAAATAAVAATDAARIEAATMTSMTTMMTARRATSGLGNGDGAALWIDTLMKGGGDFLTRGKSLWEAKKLTPLQGASPSRAIRSYGFCRERFIGTSSEELDLELAELVYIDAKLRHEETKEIWICGERSRGGLKRAGLFPLRVIDVIIDL